MINAADAFRRVFVLAQTLAGRLDRSRCGPGNRNAGSRFPAGV